MKKLFTLIAIAMLATSATHAQNITHTLGTDGTFIINSTDGGMLIPRMTMGERDLITALANGLMIYQTDNTSGFYYYNGSAWVGIGSGTSSINNLSDGISDNTKNVFLGTGVGINNVESGPWAGQYNVGLGIEALNQGVNISKSVAIGYKALYNNNTTRNTAIGYEALMTASTGSGNTAIGPEALKATNGSNNAAFGEFSLASLGNGDENTAIGPQSGTGLTTGTKNVFLGYSAAYSQTGGNKNIAIGESVVLANLTGDNQLNIGNTIYATGMTSSGVKVGIGNDNKAPTSTLDVKGSFSLPYFEGNAVATPLTDAHYTYNVIGHSGSSVVLPSAVGIKGRVYVIKNTHTANEKVVPTPSLGQTIDGQIEITLAQYKFIKVQSTGANWIIIGQN